jgi:hypothetical protein
MAPRLSFAGFKDPASRPRYIIWTAVAILALAAVVIIALGVTSTRWFCAEGCHKVQDDTIAAYERSPHAKISCMACHMPVNANPIIFVLHKAEALGELAMTVTNNYELPLNAESEVALNMKSTQCTQCHDPEKRPVTPSVGIVIDHKIHADKKVTCGICHNRTAHVEDFELTLTDPKTGKPNKKHEDFMKMTACFRCHSQQKDSKAPTGSCAACHTPEFQLKPPSHLEPGFYPAGHAKLGLAEEKRVLAAGGKAFLESSETSEQVKAAERTNETKPGEGIGPELRKVQTINECSTCHARSFCTDCHKLPMPHPPTFKKDHGAVGKANPTVCVTCHGNATTFCNECHHGSAMGVTYNTGKPWLHEHPNIVKQVGASACFKCHNPTFCSACHVNGPGQQK